MTAKARFTQADITRILRGAASAGLTSYSIVIEPDGAIEVRVLGPDKDHASARNEWQDLE